jgi:hypothetical protein
MSILRLEGWKGSEIALSYKDSELKYLEEKASKLHNEVDDLNKYLVNADFKYIIDTFITGSEEKKKYKLSVKIKQYVKSENEHKKDSHRQEINI